MNALCTVNAMVNIIKVLRVLKLINGYNLKKDEYKIWIF